VSYWLIERHRSELSIEKQVAGLRPGICELSRSVDSWLSGLERQVFEARARELEQGGVPASLARQVAATTPLQSAPDIVELSQVRRIPVIGAAEAYFAVGEAFGLDWLRQHIEALDITGHWQAVARGSLREAMSETHRRLAQRILEETRERDPRRAVEQWRKRHPAETSHAQSVVSDIRSQPADADFASLSVALQTVRRLALIES
jgi:glutamate dehydrogenase